MKIEEFEQKHGKLQLKYNEWRKAQENVGQIRLIDCGFRSARESFATYCGLSEVPFEVMLRCETNYERNQKRATS